MLSTFSQDGYFIARKVLPEAEILRIRAEINQIIVQQLTRLGLESREGATQGDLLINCQTLLKANKEVYLSALRLCAKLCSVYEAYLHPAMKKMARELGVEFPVFQTQPVLHLMAKKLKIESGYFGVGAHQDWPALQSGLDTLTCWFPLFPVRQNGFTLEVLPGSHLNGLLPSAQTEHYHEVSASAYDATKLIAIEMEPGDALFFSTFLVHRSETVGDDQAFRIAFSMRYENAANPYFIDKSYPFAQKRVVDRTLPDGVIPSQEQVQAVYRR